MMDPLQYREDCELGKDLELRWRIPGLKLEPKWLANSPTKSSGCKLACWLSHDRKASTHSCS